MTGLLRFIGLLNAAVWLGSTAFFTLVTEPALLSADMKHLLGQNNYPFFAGAITQVVARRFFVLQIVCASIALVHMLAAWLYLGKTLRRLNTSIVAGLFILALACALLIGPKIEQLHMAKFAKNQPADLADAAAKSLQLWLGLGRAVNFIILAGVTVYFVRIASVTGTPSPPRFVPPLKLGI